LPHQARADHFDVEQDMMTVLCDASHFLLERAVPMAVVLRVLQEVTCRDPAFEFLTSEEVVFAAFLFTRARRPGCRGDRIPRIRALVHDALCDGCLAAARRRGQHYHQWLHSRFSSCSRIFSSSPFI